MDLQNNECPVQSLTGSLSVSYMGGEQNDVPLFEEDEPIVFKFGKNWTGTGRRTFGFPKGHILVITPNTWRRTGNAPVEHDLCADSNFYAHYFYRDQGNNTKAKDIDGFEEHSMIATYSIELEGQTVFDCSGDGDLFVGGIPVLKPSKDVLWARVGQEEENGWIGESFKPSERPLSEIINGREGRFFLRAYDFQMKLIDSICFRYFHGLKEILVDNELYTQDTIRLPSPEGYLSTEIKFLNPEGKIITPTDIPEAARVTNSGVIEVPPQSVSDQVVCTLKDSPGKIDVVVDIPRIWWRIESSSVESEEWHDKPLGMTKQEFKKYADMGAILCILSRRHESLKIGFDEEVDRTYKWRKSEEFVQVPFEDFADYDQIRPHVHLSKASHFNIKWSDRIIPIIQIAADPKPKIVLFKVEPKEIHPGETATLHWNSQNAGRAKAVISPDIGEIETEGTLDVTPTKTISYTLTLLIDNMNKVVRETTLKVYSPSTLVEPMISYVCHTCGGWRKGKGFSIREIENAGLNRQEAIDRSIRIDKRRRSSHTDNIEKLRRVLDG